MQLRSALLIAVAACGGSKTPTPNPPPTGTDPPEARVEPAKPEPPPGRSKPVQQKTLAAIGLDGAAIDRSADPCQDFYEFACGNWVKTTEIPADKPLAMRSFVAIEDRNAEYAHGVLDAARAKGDDPMTKMLGAYYGSCLDEASIEKAGTKPIAPLLATIDRVRDAKSLTAAVAVLHAAGMNALFTLGPVQDSADARNVIAEIGQGGIGLPDRDYYLKDEMKGVLGKYEQYVAAMLTELGRKPDVAKTEAADVIALETQIAKTSKDKVAMRDPKGVYNKIDRAGVAKAMGHFDWNGFWAGVGLKDVQGVTVNAPEFLTGVDALVASTKPEVWRAYLTFHVGNRTAQNLSKKLEDTRFTFIAMLTGQQEQQPRWRRCTDRTEQALGDMFGQVFVKDRFPGASKSAAEDYVHAISGAMAANLGQLPWMDATTKQKANDKLGAMAYQIGYPKKWKTYQFKIDPKSYGANALAATKANHARQLAKIGKPTDRDDWEATAQTVNAYYNPQLNGMVFPAGILQPPFYNVDASVPVNLGAMGSVVGHELTHGFDDQGAQYDAVGNLTDWWQPETAKQFKARTQCVIDQYSQYEVAGGTKVNGANTVGENIADIGGVKLALTAFRTLRAGAPETVVADGFTEDQQFFLAFGQAWCAKMRPDFEKLLATVDVHSPAKWRVNGAVSATPDFSKVWSCKAGSKMAPAKQCVVW